MPGVREDGEIVRKSWDRLTGGMGMRREPQPGSPVQLGERLPVFGLPLKLVLPEHGVGLRAGQERGAGCVLL